jgi:hypothetical protein
MKFKFDVKSLALALALAIAIAVAAGCRRPAGRTPTDGANPILVLEPARPAATNNIARLAGDRAGAVADRPLG